MHRKNPTGFTYRVWWWTVWWFSLYSQEEVQHPPTLPQVLKGGQTVSIHCLLNTGLSDWACNKLVHSNIEKSHFIIFKSKWERTVFLSCVPTYTCHQDPGARWTRRSTNSFSQTFCSVDATGEYVIFIAFVPPETTNKTRNLFINIYMTQLHASHLSYSNSNQLYKRYQWTSGFSSAVLSSSDCLLAFGKCFIPHSPSHGVY